MRPVSLRRSPARLLLLGLALLAIPLIAQASHPSPLPDDITTPNQNYHVHYTDNTPSPPGTDLNYMPQAQAQNMANALDNSNAVSVGNPNGYHAGYVNLGFGAPDFNGAERQVQVFDCGAHGGCDSGNAPADRINMPATGYKTQSEACIRLVLGHELFHHVQYSYITFNKWSTWGGVPVEGTARLMQDKVYTDLDGGAGCITYPGEANNYLGNPNQTMWNISYTSALFWNYMMEQLGTTNTEPTIGTDFIRRFWENAQANNASPDTVGTIRQTIGQFAPGRTLEDVFHDFSIANYAKNLNTSALPNAARYRYRDENDGTGSTYNVVNKTWTGNIPPTKGPQADSVVAWGAKYYEATPSADCTILGFKSTGDTAAYGLIASTGTGTPSAQRIAKSVTNNFARAYINRPGNRSTKLGASVAGLSNPASFTYTFACGGARLQIVRPTSAYKAYVGDPGEPDQFLAIVNVYGPTELGEPSVEGLDVSDFQAWVGAEDPANVAPILSGSYVQGSYWLVIQAPTKGAEGDFPLLIKLGTLSADTKTDAVRYAKLVRNQEIVIDASGSMSDPAGNPKIDAAKNAARLFVDAAPNSDKLGVAWFSGDGAEPNDDAFVLHALQDVNGQRTNAKNAINTLTTHNLTSIGDGLNKGQNQINTNGSPLGQDYMVLLSDGMENEAALWNDVKAGIIGAGTTVFSIALGPEADQALMQNIASSTGGDYLYVDLSGASPAPPAAQATSAPDAASTLANRLADAFNFANEAIRRNQRIWEQRGTVAPGATQSLIIPINEDGLTDAVFSVNWTSPAAAQVRLFKPNNTQVTPGAGVQVLTDGTHAVFQLPEIDMLGNWRLEVQNGSGGDLPFTAAFSAKGYKGVKMLVFFGQTPADPAGATLDKVFLKGLPMPVIAVLTSINGAVAGADVVATIERPDGTLDTLPLHDDGNHGDGVAGDGIYANLYTRTDLASTFGVDDRSTAPGTRGSYNVVVTAKGKSDTGEFTRIRHGSFQVYELNRDQGNPDSDQDGMPDRWEELHGCLSAKLNDAKLDPDGDGLTSIDEYQLGTDPCKPDTDKGGERDGSEVRRGANPLFPRDDKAVKLIDVEVLHEAFDHLPDPPVKPNQNTIRYPVLRACALIRVERAEVNAAGGRTPFKRIDEFDPARFGGLYPDPGLQNNVTYIYRLTCIGGNGEEGEPSNEFRGTPREDPLPPTGNVTIERGRPFVSTVGVRVQLTADEDTVLMRVSNDSRMEGAQWQTFQPEIQWQLAPNSKGYAIVYAQFRDRAGNESTVYFDDVTVRSRGLLGAVRGRAILIALAPAGADAGEASVPAASSEGIYVGVKGQSDVPPAFTDANGNFELPDLPPGEYTLLFQMTGFITETQKVLVQAGATTETPPVELKQGARIFLPLTFR